MSSFIFSLIVWHGRLRFRRTIVVISFRHRGIPRWRGVFGMAVVIISFRSRGIPRWSWVISSILLLSIAITSIEITPWRRRSIAFSLHPRWRRLILRMIRVVPVINTRWIVSSSLDIAVTWWVVLFVGVGAVHLWFNVKSSIKLPGFHLVGGRRVAFVFHSGLYAYRGFICTLNKERAQYTC